MNKFIIVSLVTCLCSSIYGRDLLYGTFKKQFSGNIKVQINKAESEYKARLDKIKKYYDFVFKDCGEIRQKNGRFDYSNKCWQRQRKIFEKKYGDSLGYALNKVEFVSRKIKVADIYGKSIGGQSIGEFGVELVKEARGVKSKFAKVYVSLENGHYSDFVFFYGVVEKFENGRVKLLSNQDMWISVDDMREVFKFKDDVFKLTREELRKKYTFAGKSLGCKGEKFACVHGCGVGKVKDDHVIMYLESDGDPSDDDKVMINELLNSNGEFACGVSYII